MKTFRHQAMPSTEAVLCLNPRLHMLLYQIAPDVETIPTCRRNHPNLMLKNMLVRYQCDHRLVWRLRNLFRAYLILFQIVNNIFGNNKNGIRSKIMFALRGALWKDVRNTVTPTFTTGKMKSVRITIFIL